IIPWYNDSDSARIRQAFRMTRTTNTRKLPPARACMRALRYGSMAIAVLLAAGCAVGPDYQKPNVQIPATFKEGVD
ncbi:hypothetical protein, partial [Escherichia coli]|uniref:hypothetical protein n=1 Tax=Escherichia coli TaxID=562 RepID=UPI00256F61D0